MKAFCKEFPADPTSVRQARAFIAAALGAAHPFADAAVLVVSELATNAVRYGTSTTYTVAVTCDARSAHLAVTNTGSHALGDAAYSDTDAESGRGLALVRDYSTAWSVTQDVDTIIHADFGAAAVPVAA